MGECTGLTATGRMSRAIAARRGLFVAIYGDRAIVLPPPGRHARSRQDAEHEEIGAAFLATRAGRFLAGIAAVVGAIGIANLAGRGAGRRRERERQRRIDHERSMRIQSAVDAAKQRDRVDRRSVDERLRDRGRLRDE